MRSLGEPAGESSRDIGEMQRRWRLTPLKPVLEVRRFERGHDPGVTQFLQGESVGLLLHLPGKRAGEYRNAPLQALTDEFEAAVADHARAACQVALESRGTGGPAGNVVALCLGQGRGILVEALGRKLLQQAGYCRLVLEGQVDNDRGGAVALDGRPCREVQNRWQYVAGPGVPVQADGLAYRGKLLQDQPRKPVPGDCWRLAGKSVLVTDTDGRDAGAPRGPGGDRLEIRHDGIIGAQVQCTHVAEELWQVVVEQRGQIAQAAGAGDKGQTAAVEKVAEGLHVAQLFPGAARKQPGDFDIVVAQGGSHGPGATDVPLTGSLYTVEQLHASPKVLALARAITVPMNAPATVSPGKCTPSSTRDSATIAAQA